MQISSLGSKIIVTENFQNDLTQILDSYSDRKIFIIDDSNTHRLCLPLLSGIEALRDAETITIGSGEEHKNIASTIDVWNYLSDHQADRKSLVINLGGGMICDLGGFAASTFKRGLDFINIPTTLLAQVDASIGGKLGVNYNGLKNEIGLFRTPNYVLVYSDFLKTLERKEFLSGLAEMIKHALIYSVNHWERIKELNFSEDFDYKAFQKIIAKSIFIKNDFVQTDFREQNIRKALNFGHTIGHALESFMLEKQEPVPHGAAVAHGIVCELYLSHRSLGFDKAKIQPIADYIFNLYGKIHFELGDYAKLYALMKHDKKNEERKILFTMLSDIGEVEVNKVCPKKNVFEAFDFYQSYGNE